MFLFLCAIYVTYIVAGLLAHPDWHPALRHTVVPSVTWNSVWLLTVVAAIGTTITPWGQFFIQATVVDKKISLRSYAYTKAEVFLGRIRHRRGRLLHRHRLRRHAVEERRRW